MVAQDERCGDFSTRFWSPILFPQCQRDDKNSSRALSRAELRPAPEFGLNQLRPWISRRSASGSRPRCHLVAGERDRSEQPPSRRLEGAYWSAAARCRFSSASRGTPGFAVGLPLSFRPACWARWAPIAAQDGHTPRASSLTKSGSELPHSKRRLRGGEVARHRPNVRRQVSSKAGSFHSVGSELLGESLKKLVDDLSGGGKNHALAHTGD